MLPHFTDEETEFQRDECLSLSGWPARGGADLHQEAGSTCTLTSAPCLPIILPLSAPPENGVLKATALGPVEEAAVVSLGGPDPAFLMLTRPAPPPTWRPLGSIGCS